MSNTRDAPGSSTFRRWVMDLKRRGCNVLVTGDVGEETSRRLTRKLLGAPDVPRTRVLALTDRDREDAPALLPEGVSVDDDAVHLLDYDAGTRSASGATATAPDPNAGRAPKALDDLRLDLCDAVAAAAADGLDPAQLRVGVYTLSYLTSQRDPEAVEQFVRAVGDHVRGVSGMAHYHLPVPDDADRVARLAPLFDVRIELRETNGAPEQRWHFPDRDATTAWVGL